MKPRVFKAGGLWWAELEFGAVSAVSWREALNHALRYA